MHGCFQLASVLTLTVSLSVPAMAVCQEAAPRVDQLGDPLEAGVVHRFGTRRLEHPGAVVSVQVSRAGNTIVSFGAGVVIGWDAESGKQLWSRKTTPEDNHSRLSTGYGIHVMSTATQTGEVVSLSAGDGFPLWNPRTGETTQLPLEGADPQAKSIDISGDGKLIAVGSEACLQVFNRQGDRLFEIPNVPTSDIRDAQAGGRGDRLSFPGEFSDARFSPDGRVLALVNSEKPRSVQLFDARSGQPIGVIAGQDRIVRFAFSPDGSTIATTERDVSVRLYSVRQQEPIWVKSFPPAPGAESYTTAIAFDPSRPELAVGITQGPRDRVVVLSSKGGEVKAELPSSDWRPWCLDYSPNGSLLTFSGWGGRIERWQRDGDSWAALRLSQATGTCDISPMTDWLAYVDTDSRIHLASQSTGRLIKDLPVDKLSWSALRFDPSGQFLAGTGADQDSIHLFVWEVATDRQLQHWSWPKGTDPHSTAHGLTFDNDLLAASVFRQSAAYVWNWKDGQQLATVSHREVFGSAMTVGRLTTVGWDSRITEWDPVGGQQLRSLDVASLPGEERNDGSRRMYSVHAAHDGSFIATTDMSNSIRIYDQSLREVVVIPRAGGAQRPFALSRNELWVAYGNYHVHLFDVASGELVWTGHRHNDTLESIGFGRGDRTVLSGGSDGVCNLCEFPVNYPAGLAFRLFEDLVGNEGRPAFKAFQYLQAHPDLAVEILESRLALFLNERITEDQIRFAIIALAARDRQVALQARKTLRLAGPTAAAMLNEEFETNRRMGVEKQATVGEMAFHLKFQYRRVQVLLAQLDTPKADAAIDRLLESASSEPARAFVQQIQTLRARLSPAE